MARRGNTKTCTALNAPGENLLDVLNDAVAVVVALIDDGEGTVGIRIAESEEAVLQQVHLQDRLVPRHGLQGEALGTQDAEFFLLRLDRCKRIGHIDRSGKGILPQTALQAGLILLSDSASWHLPSCQPPKPPE